MQPGKGSGMSLVAYIREVPVERQPMCLDFIRTTSFVIEKPASLLCYPILVKTTTLPGWAVVISSAKLAERQGT